MSNDDNEKRAIRLSDSQLKDVVKETISETFIVLGIDIKDPLEVQKDFQHMRAHREATTIVKKRALHGFVGIIVAGTLATFWLGFKELLN